MEVDANCYGGIWHGFRTAELDQNMSSVVVGSWFLLRLCHSLIFSFDILSVMSLVLMLVLDTHSV
jgi:hypothetical protein